MPFIFRSMKQPCGICWLRAEGLESVLQKRFTDGLRQLGVVFLQQDGNRQGCPAPLGERSPDKPCIGS